MNTQNTLNAATKINPRRRSALLLSVGLLTAGSAVLLAGCGGGGGNGNTVGTTTTGTIGTGTTGTTGTPGTGSTAQIAGKVTDTFGNGIPGVSISVDTGGQITSTISQGGYRLASLTAAVHKISAAATVNGMAYSGSTQASAVADSLVSNINILLSPTGRQATVQGYVRDTSGAPIVGASVYAAIPTPSVNGTSGNYSSLVAFTDSSGFYSVQNIPSDLRPGTLLVTASAGGGVNQNVTLPQTSITPNSVTTQNFTLADAAKVQADVPALVGINAFTQPTDGLVGSALQARLSSTGAASVYEGLRRRLSPSYAAFAARRHAAVGKKLIAHATGSAYAVEVDVAFTPPAATDTNLAGYNVYRTTGPLATNPISEMNTIGYDSFRDPLANYYTDLTATSDNNLSYYKSDTAYNFALSSISTTNLESALSPQPYTITPLGPLTLSVPAANATVTSPVTLTWNAVTGATKYYAYIYTQYPSIDTTPINSTQTPLPVGTTSATVMLGGAGTYYAVVVAAADETVTATATAPVANAAQSYSAIVPFTVQ